MKSEIKIKIGNEWKSGGQGGVYFQSGKGGGSYKGTKKFTVPTAVKFVVDSFKAQGIVPVVSYEADYVRIAA